MTNVEIGRHYLQQANIILGEAGELFKKGAWNLVVRRSQEAVELTLKAVLRNAGIEVPREHDVSWLLERHKKKLPATIQKELSKIRRISRQLRKERETSFYGDDETGLPPSELYTQFDAEQSLADAEYILGTSKNSFFTIRASKASRESLGILSSRQARRIKSSSF